MTMIAPIVRNTIKQKIEQLIDIGEKNKSEIYSRITEDFEIERREVRLIARELRQEWANKIKILESEIEPEQR